jgi:hypothetical protein
MDESISSSQASSPASSGEAVALVLKSGMHGANRIAALNKIVDSGSEEQKAAAMKNLMEIGGV